MRKHNLEILDSTTDTATTSGIAEYISAATQGNGTWRAKYTRKDTAEVGKKRETRVKGCITLEKKHILAK